MSAITSPIREPLVLGQKTYHDITEDLCAPTERTPSKAWVLAIIAAVSALTFGVVCILITIWIGIGTWDLNRTIGWGWDITNFVWWIGIGHAGTLISAILLLFRQKWRTLGDHALVGEARAVGLLGALELVPEKPSHRRFPDPS